mgnify:CR=1 FL=1
MPFIIRSDQNKKGKQKLLYLKYRCICLPFLIELDYINKHSCAKAHSMNKSNYSDQQLITMLASNSKQEQNLALDLIYQLYYSKVERWVKDKKNIQNRAPDLFQEAVVALWKTIRKGTFKSNKIFPFLITICKYKWINELKKLHDTTPITPEEMLLIEKLPTEKNSEIERKECESYVSLVLKKVLKKNCIDVLTLFFFEEKKDKESASLLNYNNAKTVKATRNRCLKQLRTHLDKRPRFRKFMRNLFRYS